MNCVSVHVVVVDVGNLRDVGKKGIALFTWLRIPYLLCGTRCIESNRREALHDAIGKAAVSTQGQFN